MKKTLLLGILGIFILSGCANNDPISSVMSGYDNAFQTVGTSVLNAMPGEKYGKVKTKAEEDAQHEKNWNNAMKMAKTHNDKYNKCAKGGYHNMVEIGRTTTKTWYDPAIKRYRHTYKVYMQCQKCGHRTTKTESG